MAVCVCYGIACCACVLVRVVLYCTLPVDIYNGGLASDAPAPRLRQS